MEMTQQQKTRDLAEKVMGWKYWDTSTDFDGDGIFFAFWDCGHAASVYEDDSSGDPTRSFWPFTSRDDAHELLAKLTDEQWPRVQNEFYNVLLDENGAYAAVPMRLFLTATPAQISEAVWRVTC